MEPKRQSQTCTSVFKQGHTISRTQFTKKWIELINRLEKDKTLTLPRHRAENRPSCLNKEMRT